MWVHADLLCSEATFYVQSGAGGWRLAPSLPGNKLYISPLGAPREDAVDLFEPFCT